MTIQIAVRLPDEQVRFLDALVAEGSASSRAEVISRALARETRRLTALRDAEILAAVQAQEPHGDLDDLAAHVAAHPAPLD
ncbi:MAG: ribbon-helix-helix domain-containing protein [Kineosporiaceae bacterium]